MAFEEHFEEVRIPDKKGEDASIDVNDEVEIEIVDDTPESDRNREPMTEDPEPSEEELLSYSDKVKKRIHTLQRAYHEERRAKESADRERQEALRYAQSVATQNKQLYERVNTDATLLHESWKSKTETDLVSAKAAYKNAYESGDSDALLEAQEALNRATYRHEQSLSKQPPLQERETVVQSNQDVYTAPPPDERAKSWASKNPWFGKDKQMTGFVYGVHEDLISRGVHPVQDAEKYYAEINKAMRRTFPTYEWEPGQAPRRNTATNVVAPVTRATASRKVALSQTQVAIAKRLNIPLSEYAKQVALLNGGSNA
jgi:hypothetical protein